MKTANQLRLKQSSGWFAAGREVQQAAMLLSDGAFKVFVWLCLQAERSSGVLDIVIADIALALRKDHASVQCCLAELVETGVCRWRTSDQLEIHDRFWPYERLRRDATEERSSYIAAVCAELRRYHCVQCCFTPADEALAMRWHQRRVSLETVARAILLGVLRKYVALLNRGGGSRITTLHYFNGLIDEVAENSISPDYWRFAARKLDDLEHRWLARPHAVADAGRKETK